MRRLFSTLAIALATLAVTTIASAADLRLTQERTLPAIEYIRPDWPVPDDRNQIFFVQRSTNPNTVVYTARYEADGAIDADDPVGVYWRRFNDDGAVRALNFIENRAAFGVRTDSLGNGQFDVRMRALPDLRLVLAEASDGPALYLPREAGVLRLSFAYLEIDDSGLVPSVTNIILTGRDTQSGAVQRLTYAVADGEFGETE